MTELEVLNCMIKDSAKVSLISKNDSDTAYVILKEPQSPTSEVTIYGLPLDAIVVKVDKFKSPDAILTANEGQRKRADYIIISNKGGKKSILHIEIKTTNYDKKNTIKQLKGSVCFVDYCRAIAKQFWGEHKFLIEFHPRFVCFAHTGSIQKRPTKINKKSGGNGTPERMMKVSNPNKLQFNQLIGA